MFAADCDPGGLGWCRINDCDVASCDCYGPTQDGLEYKEADGVLYARRKVDETPEKIIGSVSYFKDAILIHGDAKELASTTEKADVVVTDPPYMLTKGGKTGTGPSGGWMSDYKNDGKVVPCDITWPEIFKVIWDCSAPQSDIYVMCNARNMQDALNAAGVNDFRFHNILVWHKRTCTPNRWYMTDSEFVLYLYKGAARPINDCGSKQSYSVPQIDVTEHPTEKPVDLMRLYIENSTQRGDIVCDPFMGSGTTGVAAINAGRRFIGCEIHKPFYDMAAERVAGATAFHNLFTNPGSGHAD